MSIKQFDSRPEVTVISKEVRLRNLLVETDFSPLFIRFRNDKLSLSRYLFLMILFFSVVSLTCFSQNAKRVISLAPSITENLYLIGAQNKLVGCTSFCTLAIADGKEQIGSTVDVNIEKILMLQPDLVLAMLLTKPQDIETMRKLGIKVEVIPTPRNFSEICSQTIEIAKLVGCENAAKEIVQKSKLTVDSLKQKSGQHRKKLKIFFQLGANPIFTVLENTFMNDFILLCNGENIANGLTKGSVTRESVLMKNPDVIIVATMGGFGAGEQKLWKSYPGLKAAKNNKIFLIDSETACSPTPVNFVKAFTDVVNFVNQ
jgi:ABC-type Fe3+-hydroxamate transport system substrate-binding protein